MAPNKHVNMGLTSYEELFSTQEQKDDEKHEKIMNIPLEELHPFKDHPFRVVENDELRELAKSISEHGVVTPAIARPLPDGGYELISGHRRKEASGLAGLKTMPVVVRELDDDAATIIMVDSNQQRENLLPSEKAFSYKMKLDAMNRQGKRTDLTSTQLVSKLRTSEKVAEENGESRETIRRFIRLTSLIPQLLKMVDEKRIAMSPAVELSYLPKKMQEVLCDCCEVQQCTPSLSQAVRLKALQQSGGLNEAELLKIMSQQKANQREKLTFPAEKFAAYFPKGYTTEQMEQSIIKMLEERKRKLQLKRRSTMKEK
jgi:ParB family chromosome partitioning protein